MHDYAPSSSTSTARSPSRGIPRRPYPPSLPSNPPAAWDAAFSSALAAVKRCSSRFFIGNGGEAAKQSADVVCDSVEAGGLAKAFADFGLLA